MRPFFQAFLLISLLLVVLICYKHKHIHSYTLISFNIYTNDYSFQNKLPVAERSVPDYMRYFSALSHPCGAPI
jgi:hypothetical protein